MLLTMRPYQTAEDYWRVRPFLREVYLLNGRRQASWPVARWDYWRWPGVESWGDGPLEGSVFIWETPDGRLGAVLNQEGKGNAYLQVHPAWRSPALEAEMLDVAEAHLAMPDAQGHPTLCAWADAGDALRQALLLSRGYIRQGDPEIQHHRDLTAPVPEAPLPAGFTVRALSQDELPARAYASWQAFHPGEPDAGYDALGWQWYLDIQRCPLYRRDLDLVVEAPNGDLAAFCGLWYDDVTRSAYIEPVATHPDYQRRGLAKAMLCEGQRRAQRLGATLASVTGYSTAANALYSAVCGPAYDVSEPWVKVLAP
jgi:ribosomal protein S18 acetylase RimI-like enzyme